MLVHILETKKNIICIAVGYAKEMNEMKGSDLGLQDRIQIYNASYSHYQPRHAAAEIFSSKPWSCYTFPAEYAMI